MLPVLHGFGAGDDGLSRLLGAVGDALLFRTGVPGVHIFPVQARSDDDLIAGQSDLRRLADGLEGALLCAGAASQSGGGNINLHIFFLLSV